MTTEPTPTSPPTPADVAEWKKIVIEFQKPSTGRALWQIINTLGPYALLWYLMYRSLALSWWLTVPLAVLAGAFLVRVFIIFHDCGHGSFFKSRRANDLVGFFTGILTFTPFYHWRWEHVIHHASSGNLDKRGTGDVWTMTVQEYLESTRWKRFAYRLARNPVVLFVLAPLFLFVIRQRFPSSKANPRERWSVHWMNLAILGVAAPMSWAFGLVPYLLIQLTVMAIAGGVGVWLFYVQHQFEEAYWERTEQWDYAAAALQGSSFYKLPKIFQWFSGNIGFHHIHHLSARIPNYNLERCHRSHPMFRNVKPITIRSSLKSFPLRLWDEKLKKLVGFRHLRDLRRNTNHSHTSSKLSSGDCGRKCEPPGQLEQTDQSENFQTRNGLDPIEQLADALSTMNEFQFNCPKCGQNILAAGNWGGRRMTCPSCETRIIIPAPTAAPKKGRGRPVGTEAPPQARIRVQLPPKTAGSASASAPSKAQIREVRRRRQ